MSRCRPVSATRGRRGASAVLVGMALVTLQSADVAVAATAAKPDTKLADHFAVAPDIAPDHQLIV